MPDEKTPLTDVLQRAGLITRLSLAAGLLRGQGWPDSSEAVMEAAALLRALPVAEAVHKALQPESMTRSAYERFKETRFDPTNGDRFGSSLRDVPQRLKEFNAMFPLVDGQTLKPVADQDEHEGSTPD